MSELTFNERIAFGRTKFFTSLAIALAKEPKGPGRVKACCAVLDGEAAVTGWDRDVSDYLNFERFADWGDDHTFDL